MIKGSLLSFLNRTWAKMHAASLIGGKTSLFSTIDRLHTPRPFVDDEGLHIIFTTYIELPGQYPGQWYVMQISSADTLKNLHVERYPILKLPKTFHAYYSPLIIIQENGCRIALVQHKDDQGVEVGTYAYDAPFLSGPYQSKGQISLPVPSPYFGATSCDVVLTKNGPDQIYYTVTGPRNSASPRRILQARTKDWHKWELFGEPVAFDGLVAGPSIFRWNGSLYMLCCWQPKWTDHNEWNIALLRQHTVGSWQVVNKNFLPSFGHPAAFSWMGQSLFIVDNNNDVDSVYFFRFESEDSNPTYLGMYDIKKDRFSE